MGIENMGHSPTEKAENNANLKDFYANQEWYKSLTWEEQKQIDNSVNSARVPAQAAGEESQEQDKDHWYCFAEKEYRLIQIDQIMKDPTLRTFGKVAPLLQLRNDMESNAENYKAHGVNCQPVFTRIYDAIKKSAGEEYAIDLYDRIMTDRSEANDPFYDL